MQLLVTMTILSIRAFLYIMEMIISSTILIGYCVLKITEPIQSYCSKFRCLHAMNFLEVEKFYSYEKLDQLFILYVTKGGGPRVQ